jgi:type II secretory pathway component PulF
MFKHTTEIPALPYDMVVDQNESLEFTSEMDRLINAGVSINQALDITQRQIFASWN